MEPIRDPKKKTGARKGTSSPEKLVFGQFGRVRLTREEHATLIAAHGERGHKAIAKLDSYLESRGDRYKSHYAAMYSWVLGAVEEEEARRSGGAGMSALHPRTYAQAQDLERRMRAERLLRAQEREYGESRGDQESVGTHGNTLPALDSGPGTSAYRPRVGIDPD